MGFLAPAIPAIVGGGLGLLGASRSARAQDRATNAAVNAAQFRPYNVAGPGSYTDFDINGAVRGMLGGGMERIRENLFGQLEGSQLYGDPGGQGVTDAQYWAGMGLPTEFAGAQEDLNTALGTQEGGVAELAARNRGLFGADPTNRALGLSQGPGIVDPQSAISTGRGLGLTGQGPGAIQEDVLANLRGTARTGEERAVNQRVQDLYNRGILSSTSGARSFGELARQQEEADMQRQVMAKNIGLDQFSRMQQAGQGLLGIGQSGFLQGRGLNQSLGMNIGQLDAQNLARQGLLSDQLFNAQNILAGGYGTRGQQRLANAQNIFNFGNAAQTRLQNRQSGMLADLMNLDDSALDAVRLGGNIGGQASGAGANVANAIMANAGDPVGGLLTGFGGSMLQTGLESAMGIFNKPRAGLNRGTGVPA